MTIRIRCRTSQKAIELGLNPNRESTDRDKFDDGQELFGTTYCPGSAGFCGYGSLPRTEDNRL